MRVSSARRDWIDVLVHIRFRCRPAPGKRRQSRIYAFSANRFGPKTENPQRSSAC